MESISLAVDDFRHHNNKVNIISLLTEQKDWLRGYHIMSYPLATHVLYQVTVRQNYFPV